MTPVVTYHPSKVAPPTAIAAAIAAIVMAASSGVPAGPVVA